MKEQEKNHKSAGLGSLAAGAAVGAAAAMAANYLSKKENRATLGKKLAEMKEKSRKKLGEMREHGENIKTKAEEVKDEAAEKVEKNRSKIEL